MPHLKKTITKHEDTSTYRLIRSIFRIRFCAELLKDFARKWFFTYWEWRNDGERIDRY